MIQKISLLYYLKVSNSFLKNNHINIVMPLINIEYDDKELLSIESNPDSS